MYQTVCKVMSGFTDEFYKSSKAFYESEDKIIPSKKSYYDVDESFSPSIWFEPTEVRGEII